MLSAQELSWAQEKGMPVIDIRPRQEYVQVRQHFSRRALLTLVFWCFVLQLCALLGRVGSYPVIILYHSLAGAHTRCQERPFLPAHNRVRMKVLGVSALYSLQGRVHQFTQRLPCLPATAQVVANETGSASWVRSFWSVQWCVRIANSEKSICGGLRKCICVLM